MRYKLRLSKSLKNNFILLPANSPLRQSLTSKTYLSFDSNNVTPIKITPLTSLSNEHQNDDLGKAFYFGYSGGTSSEESVVEISE